MCNKSSPMITLQSNYVVTMKFLSTELPMQLPCHRDFQTGIEESLCLCQIYLMLFTCFKRKKENVMFMKIPEIISSRTTGPNIGFL